MPTLPHSISHIRTISRPRLLESLRIRPGIRLINVVAPAGYGKTTFVADWARSLAEPPVDSKDTAWDAAWNTLFDDVRPERLLRDILRALLPLLPSLQSILNLDGSLDDDEASLPQRVRMLCSEIAAAKRPIVLILDDYHLLKTPDSHALVRRMLDFAPRDRFLMVLCSRTRPPLRVDDLVLEDAILTLTERDLALDHDDYTALLPLLGLDSLPPTARDDLERRCAGWVTGLKLFAYDLRITGASAFSGALPAPSSDGALRQFIESRVLSSMPAHLQEFACAAAPLPWMSADLMAAVTGASTADCARTLRELIATNAFLAELPEPSSELRFRFHPLVHDALRHAAADRPQQLLERRRAAVWLCDHDHVDEALAILDDGRLDGRPPTADRRLPSTTPTLGSDSLLLPAVGDRRSAVESLTRAVRRALIRSELTAAQRWLDALPTELLDAHAPLAVAAAWSAFLAESMTRFEPAVSRARSALARYTGADLDELRLDIAVHSIYLHILHGRMDAAARELAAAAAFAQPMDTLGYGYLHLMHALVGRNDLSWHIRMLQSAAGIFERIGYYPGVVTMLFTDALFKLRHADLRGALASATFLQGICQRRHLEHHIYARESFFLRGWLLYLLDHVEEAREVLHHMANLPIYDAQQEDTRYLCSLYLQLCDAAEADDPADVLMSSVISVADAARWAHTLESDDRVAPGQIAWPRILRDHRAGHPERCRQTIQSMHLTPDDITDQTPDTMRVAVFAGAVLGDMHTPQLADQLDACIAHLDAEQGIFMSMQVRLLSVIHHVQRNENGEALRRLEAFLPLLERSGAVRLLLDFPVLRTLLTQCNSSFARQILARFPTKSADSGLSAQETRILEHLKDGRSTKEIAALHFVTPKTIYVQIHRIYKKLGVNSRAQAVALWQAHSDSLRNSSE